MDPGRKRYKTRGPGERRKSMGIWAQDEAKCAIRQSPCWREMVPGWAPLETLIPNPESPDRPWPASSQPEGSCVCTCVLCVGVSVCTGGGVPVSVLLLAPG